MESIVGSGSRVVWTFRVSVYGNAYVVFRLLPDPPGQWMSHPPIHRPPHSIFRQKVIKFQFLLPTSEAELVFSTVRSFNPGVAMVILELLENKEGLCNEILMEFLTAGCCISRKQGKVEKE